MTNLIYTTLVFFFIYGQLKRYGFLSVITFLVVFVTTPFMFLFSSHVKTDFHGGSSTMPSRLQIVRGKYFSPKPPC